MTSSHEHFSTRLFAGTAWHYARYRPGYPQPFLNDLVERFHLDGTQRLLDLGCGTGQLTIPLAVHVAEAVGMDPEPEMLCPGRPTSTGRRGHECDLGAGQLSRPPG
jgi:trans-aconitate methyltransferase